MTRPTICILAAGMGSRLADATAELPKNLLPVADQTILDRQLRALDASGFGDRDVCVVTGHAAQRIRERYGSRFRLIHNEHYADFNNIYSVHLLAETAGSDMVLINGDTLFHPGILESLLQSSIPACLAIDATKPLGDEEMKTAYENGRLMRIGKHLEPSSATGEYIGLLRFRGPALKALFSTISAMIDHGETDHWYEAAIGRLAPHVRIGMAETAGLPWIEIDTPQDAAAAERLVPRLEAS